MHIVGYNVYLARKEDIEVKKILSIVLAVIVMMTVAIIPGTASAAQTIGVTINGKPVQFPDQPPIMVNGRVLVPLRAVFEHEDLDTEVSWNQASQTATVKAKNRSVRVALMVGNTKMRIQRQSSVEDEIVTLDVAPIILNGKTLLPIRAVLEAFGCTLLWDSKNQIVPIKTPPRSTAVQSQLNGFATRVYDDGDMSGTYVGNFVNGLRSGNGTMSYNDGRVYTGQWSNDWANGKGTGIWPNGDKYDGEFRDGLFHGYGKLTFSDGTVYEGQYSDGRANGNGRMIHINGDKYEGEWKDGAMTGYGVYSFSSGAIYEGQFDDNNLNGEGTLVDANGNKYIGEWKDSMRHGQGTLTLSNGQIYKGRWENDEFVG